MPQNKHKKRRLGTADNGCFRHRSLHKDHVWSLDFIFDTTANGRSLKWLSVVDEYTRECLALEVSRKLTAHDVVDVLRELAALRGLPVHLRSDNGPEFISRALDQWAYLNKVELDFSRPGKPTDNPFIESFNGRLREECLNQHWFVSLEEANEIVEAWRGEYNRERSHSSLGNLAPEEFARISQDGKAKSKPTTNI